MDESEQSVPDLSTPGRTSGWWDMFVHPDEDPRTECGFLGERENLIGYLHDPAGHVEPEVLWARRRRDGETVGGAFEPVAAGLVRHLTDVERFWFRRVMAGQDEPRLYPREIQWEVVVDPAMVEKAWADWHAEVEFAEGFVAEAESMDVTGMNGDEPIELRAVMTHMIEEHARHNGHADLLR